MVMLFESLSQDLRYALRDLRNKPGFAAAIVGTLALGIGANAAMFGIVDRLLLRPPPLMREPATAHRVYHYETYRGRERANTVGRFVRFADLTRWTTSFSSTAGYMQRDLAVGTGENAREMHIGVVSSTFFGFFDAPPALGRYIADAEDQVPRGASVAVLSYPMWQSQYGGRAGVLGSAIRIGPELYTIIGVSAPGFVGLWPERPPAAFIPITNYGAIQNCTSRDSVPWYRTYACGWMNMIARRKPGVSNAQANADLSQADARSYEAARVEQTRSAPTTLARPRAVAGPILAERGPNETPVAKVATWVGGVSVIVLLIACANVANLLLARALRRRREIALRMALGVSCARLVAQLLTESLVLAVLGGVAGVLVAHWGGALLRAGLLDQTETAAGLRDARTVLFAALAAGVAGLLTGIAPALQTRHVNLTLDLKADSREGTHRRSKTRLALLMLQGTLSVILLVGAGLFVRSLANVEAMHMGYDIDQVLVVGLNSRGEKLDSTQDVELKERLVRAAVAIPGVASASRQTAIPFWSNSSTDLFVAGIDSVNRLGQFSFSAVSPSYFNTIGTRIVRGRGITAEDRQEAPRVTVVSEAMSKVLWPGQDAIGQCIKVNADSMPCTYVVGIAENIKDQAIRGDSGYYYYLPITQARTRSGGLFVRTHGDAAKLLETTRKVLQAEMPGASYMTVTPFAQIVGSQKRSWHLGATMFVVFGLLALVLAAVGLYSVIAYNVAQRTHELGVRAAVGARAVDLVRLVLTEGLRVAVLAVGTGVAVALWASRWLEPLLFDVSPRDPLIYSVVASVMVAVAIAASLVPALRASRVDPNTALRAE